MVSWQALPIWQSICSRVRSAVVLQVKPERKHTRRSRLLSLARIIRLLLWFFRVFGLLLLALLELLDEIRNQVILHDTGLLHAVNNRLLTLTLRGLCRSRSEKESKTEEEEEKEST